MLGKGSSILENSITFLEEYVPAWFEKRELKEDSSPLFIFISGPQGSGKSYTTTFLHKHLVQKYGPERRIASMSIDDFYLSHDDQITLGKRFSSNKLLQGRGLPGTHDIPLLSRCLEAIWKGDESKVSLPQYDKSKFNGEGDRSKEVTVVDLPLDIVIIEGWFLGFKPVSEIPESSPSEFFQGTPDMKQIDANLQLYAPLLWSNPQICSLGIVFEADEIENVYKWRQQQEWALKLKDDQGMDDEGVKTFVDRYLPAYRLYYENMVRAEDLGSMATLTLGIDLERNVISCKSRCVE